MNPMHIRNERKPSSSSVTGCVQVGESEEDGVPVITVRSDRPEVRPDAVASFTHEEWDVFVRAVKDGEFDRTGDQTAPAAP